MIKKILIANRGEIAARIIRACRKLNIKSVAVYSEADQYSPYVKMADESFLLGPSRVNESYLNINKILLIAKDNDVDAIHPGYGFLSENSEFVKQCKDTGLIFIGPSSSMIEKMGSKIVARQIMKAGGVPIIPGTKEFLSTSDDALEAAKKIGYPVMLKASAGGGGIGMQVVSSDEELIKAFNSNARRAESFFNDGTMFLEKKLEHARHIEIQILADHHGNVIHLFDRECSIQRRNQKVIEEAPSPFISDETRKSMGRVALKVVKEIGYYSAGTIEFLVDSQENYYFLEMNTRIQVEHPITEEITNVDLVEEQINIANNKILEIKQEDVSITGHAIEARIYAEDPERFLPSPGQITDYKSPAGSDIRLESSIEKGMEVTPFYDPLISKLIVKGTSRRKAIETISKALAMYEIEGIKTNIPMLIKVIGHKEFKKGNTQTSFIDDYYLPKIAKK